MKLKDVDLKNEAHFKYKQYRDLLSFYKRELNSHILKIIFKQILII